MVTGGLRVLFVTNMWPTPERPWYGTFVRSQADSLRALGVELDVLSIPGHEARSAYLTAAREVVGRSRRDGYDVVHAHYGHSGVVARLQLRAPLVVSYCGDDLLGTSVGNGRLTPRSRVEAAVFRQLARVASATITKSRQMEERLPARLRERNRVIPSGVDVERFAPIPREEARRELGWDGEQPVVLFASDPSVPTKNYELARATADRVEEAIPDARLEVGGGHPPDRMPLVMSAADVLLLTSRSEGSPNVVKEAMAAELPVVATPVGDVEERLAGIAGCHVRPPDPAALAEGVLAALRHGRSPEARRAVAEISLDAVARRILEVYDDVTGASAGAERPRRGS